MSIPFLGEIIEKALDIVDQFVPDSDERDRTKAELIKLASNADLQLALKQMEINIEDAKKKIFTWRDLIGYFCALSIGFNFLIIPILNIFLSTPLPQLDTGPLFGLISGILGLGAARSYDKKNGSR